MPTGTPKRRTSPATSKRATAKPAVGPVRTALEATLTALRDLGRLEAVDGALVALCESTASAVDSTPTRAALVKEYRECLVLLGGLGNDGGDAFAELMDRLSGAKVGDET